MNPPIKIISTDFDGTFFAEFENPPVPGELQRLMGQLQAAGTKWVINTGRDLSSLLEALARAHLSVRPDYLVVVEREIFAHEKSQYVGWEDWNRTCAQAHSDLFARVRADVYARFSHEAYSKGTALSEIARRLGVSRDYVLAAGDHLNDLPMLSHEHARWLVAPSNAIELVKQAVRRQEGFVSDEP